MTLRTVKVPDAMKAIFERAETVVSRYFEARRDSAEEGTIEVFGERYVLVRAASLSVEFFDMVRDLFGPDRRAEADDFARNILFDLAHAIGKADARSFHSKMGLAQPIERLSAGPVHFAHTGWAFVDISEESSPGDAESFYMLYDHPYSFESDAWLRAGHTADFPVCIMSSGYSSGWCEESFGVQLVAAEVLCRAKGDDCCRFVMAHPDQIERRVEAYIQSEPDLAPCMVDYQIPDFFARKRLEDELRRARDELEQRVAERTAELVEANARLKREMQEREVMEQRLLQSQKLEALGSLAGGIAHDFNNILTAIHGYTELLLADLPSDSGVTRYALEIERSARRATELTSQLLVFSRQKVMERRVLDLNAVVQRLEDMLGRLIREDVVVSVHVGLQSVCVSADLGQLEQVIVNLVVNGGDAMPTGGELTIEVSEVAGDAGPQAALVVRDSGTGMDEDTRAQLFDPFFTTKEPGHGTGLGLATVYGIVQHYNGTIEVDSELGEGSTFTILLPRVDGPPDAFDEETMTTMVAAAPRTILLVEDERMLRDLVTIVLRRYGYTVLEAECAAEARARFDEVGGAVDLLLSDVIMRGGSGVELARELQRERPDLPVLFMSGYTSDRLGVHGLAETGAAFVQKPFTLGVLEKRIRDVLEVADG